MNESPVVILDREAPTESMFDLFLAWLFGGE